jgi:hypothetical protein
MGRCDWKPWRMESVYECLGVWLAGRESPIGTSGTRRRAAYKTAHTSYRGHTAPPAVFHANSYRSFSLE